jgi:hypothetical protein
MAGYGITAARDWLVLARQLARTGGGAISVYRDARVSLASCLAARDLDHPAFDPDFVTGSAARVFLTAARPCVSKMMRVPARDILRAAQSACRASLAAACDAVQQARALAFPLLAAARLAALRVRVAHSARGRLSFIPARARLPALC